MVTSGQGLVGTFLRARIAEVANECISDQVCALLAHVRCSSNYILPGNKVYPSVLGAGVCPWFRGLR